MGSGTAIIFGCVSVVLLAFLVIAILFHITLMKALQACSFRNQKMPPGLVWLNFVPVLSFAWPFVVAVQVGNSLKREFADRGLMNSDETFGKRLGVTAQILSLAGACLNFLGRIALDGTRSPEREDVVGCLALVLGLISLILWIVYWVKIAGFTRELNEHGRPDDRYHCDDDRDDRDDDRDYDRRRNGDDERHDDKGDTGRDDPRRGDGGLPRYPGS